MKTKMISLIQACFSKSKGFIGCALLLGLLTYVGTAVVSAADSGLATSWEFTHQGKQGKKDAPAIRPAIDDRAKRGQYGEIKPVSDVTVQQKEGQSKNRRVKNRAALDDILGNLDQETPDMSQTSSADPELDLLLAGPENKVDNKPQLNVDKEVKSARSESDMELLSADEFSGPQEGASRAATFRSREKEFPVEVRESVPFGETRAISSPAVSASPVLSDTSAASQTETLSGVFGRQSMKKPAVESETSSMATGMNPARSLDAAPLVVEHQSPNIEIQAVGPRRIIVGQESPFQIKVRNSGTVAASKLEITTEIPNWVEVVNIQPSTGTSSLTGDNGAGGPGACAWLLGDLGPNSEEVLTLHLIPRARTNFELVSRYDYERESLKAGIEVQEACLELAIEGRDAIEYSMEDKYRLRIRNSGNGDAKNVRLKVSTGTSEQISQTLGVLPAGSERSIELALKTELEGTLPLLVEAEGDYNVKASCKKDVQILRGNLEIYVESPEFQFVNNHVACLVHVANTGTASVRQARISLALPEGMELIESSEGGQESDSGRGVDWAIDQLDPGEELVCQVTCQAVAAGSERFEIVAVDPSGLSVTEEAFVQVEGVAALAIKVNSPSGPIALGTPVHYEVIVTNTGTKAAENVTSGLFLFGGLKPIGVEFGSGTVFQEESKVLFGKIAQLSPGQSQTYRVSAQAIASGNHKVQAVLRSETDGTELLSEAMTYCYESRTIAKRNAAFPNAQVALKSEPVASEPREMAIPQEIKVEIPAMQPGPGTREPNMAEELPELMTIPEENSPNAPAEFPQLPALAPNAVAPVAPTAAPATVPAMTPGKKTVEPAPLNESILGRF